MAFEGSTIDPMWLFPRQLPGSDSQGPRYLSAISSATVFRDCLLGSSWVTVETLRNQAKQPGDWTLADEAARRD
jgi:hypothetical protein